MISSLRNFAFILATSLLLASCEVDQPIAGVIKDCDIEMVENDHPIEGYSDKDSYFPGETVKLMIHTLAPTFTIEIQRNGLIDSTIAISSSIAGMVQDYPECAFRTGCNWEPVWTYALPSNLKSGMYTATLQDAFGDKFYIVFVVKPINPTGNIAVLASTNTWQAYNHWGGASFYYLENESWETGIVNFQRPNLVTFPYSNDGHLANAELHILRWLEDKGYSYDLIADRDLHDDPTLLMDYEAVIVSTHSEYWTYDMLLNFYNYQQSGGDVAYLSGNGIYFKVTYQDQQIEVRKNGANHLHDGIIGGQWRELGYPESSYIGVQYDRRGYNTVAPYEVLDSTHWVYSGTNVTQGQLIGQFSLNRGAASGIETDKITVNSPSNLIHLAKGTNADGGGADMVYFENQAGGKVFSVGSITYGGSLSVDPIMSRMLENVLDTFLVQ